MGETRTTPPGLSLTLPNLDAIITAGEASPSEISAHFHPRKYPQAHAAYGAELHTSLNHRALSVAG